MVFKMNFTKSGEHILQKFAKDEGLINYNNLLFKTSLTHIENIEI